MKRGETPFDCHVMICVNDRQGKRMSCADDGGQAIKDELKSKLKEQRLPAGAVRVSQSGCLGICETGPNVMIYPQKILFSGVTLDDVDAIVDQVKELVGG